MQDEVYRSGEQGQGMADSLPHATLDAVAVDGFAERFGNGETDAWAGCGAALLALRRAKGVELADLFGELLAAGLVDALEVSVFPQPVSGGGGHGERHVAKPGLTCEGAQAEGLP